MSNDKKQTCVVESNKIGKICVNENDFSFSITDDAMNKLKEKIGTMIETAEDEQKSILEKKLAMLDNDVNEPVRIPVDKVNAVAFFPHKDNKNESVMGMMVKQNFAKNLGLKKPYVIFGINKKDVKVLNDSIPKSVKRVKTVDSFIKILKSGS